MGVIMVIGALLLFCALISFGGDAFGLFRHGDFSWNRVSDALDVMLGPGGATSMAGNMPAGLDGALGWLLAQPTTLVCGVPGLILLLAGYIGRQYSSADRRLMR